MWYNFSKINEIKMEIEIHYKQLTFDDIDSRPYSLRLVLFVDGGASSFGVDKSSDFFADCLKHGFCGKTGAGGFGGVELSFSCATFT